MAAISAVDIEQLNSQLETVQYDILVWGEGGERIQDTQKVR